MIITMIVMIGLLQIHPHDDDVDDGDYDNDDNNNDINNNSNEI